MHPNCHKDDQIFGGVELGTPFLGQSGMEPGNSTPALKLEQDGRKQNEKSSNLWREL